ncbi:MAG: CinA family nicotinamide mononucleotide deamidase-related protein [Bergeyella sp.]
MNVSLIVIGDEILSGNTIDTNTSFIASEFKNIGIAVRQVFTISDEEETIVQTLENAFSTTDLVITTGGLGPTRDDRTLNAFSRYFGDEIITDETTLLHLKNYLEKRGRADIFDINKSQAEVLKSATVLQNDYGTAPCQMIEKNGKTVFCLPGVPFEVKPLIREKIIPILKEKFRKNHIETRIISVVGIPESVLSQRIEKWELALPKNISLSYLPIGTRIKLRLTAVGNNKTDLDSELDTQIETLSEIISENIIAKEGDAIQEIVKSILLEKNMTISSAESCTGGQISRLLTSVSGSSKYFAGSVCTYQTKMKTEILGVSPKVIEQHSVVSEEVAKAMSEGCQNLFKTDIAVSTTGVAGPTSDEENNEIGLVYYSVRIRNEEKTFRLFLPHLDRNDFMDFTAQKVLQSLTEELIRLV